MGQYGDGERIYGLAAVASWPLKLSGSAQTRASEREFHSLIVSGMVDFEAHFEPMDLFWVFCCPGRSGVFDQVHFTVIYCDKISLRVVYLV